MSLEQRKLLSSEREHNMRTIESSGIIEAKKKKKWDPNPWAVCTVSEGRDDKEKYER